MKIAYFVGSLLAGLLVLVGLANAIEKFYPKGFENTDRGGQIQVTAVPIDRAVVAQPEKSSS